MVALDGGERLRILEPIVIDGLVVGVYEIEQDYGPLAEHIREMQFFAAVGVVGFGAVLYVMLFGMVGRAAQNWMKRRRPTGV